MPIPLEVLESFASILEEAPKGVEARRAGIRTDRLAQEQSVQMEFLRNLQTSELGLEERKFAWQKEKVPESVQAARERAKGLADLQELENAYRLEAIRLESELNQMEPGSPEYEEKMARARDYNERANLAAQEREVRQGFMEGMGPGMDFFKVKQALRYEDKTRRLEEKLEKKRKKAGIKTEKPTGPKSTLRIGGKEKAPEQAAWDEVEALTKKREELLAMPKEDFWKDPEIMAILDKYGVDLR